MNLTNSRYQTMLRTLFHCELEDSFKAFQENPNVNWNRHFQAMFNYQVSLQVPVTKARELFENKPISQWAEIACMNVHGMTIADAMKSI